MTIEEAKNLIESAKSIERESLRIKAYIEQQREELLSIRSSMSGQECVKCSERISMPERVYFRLEELYVQYSQTLQRLSDKRREIEDALTRLEPIEQEIARAWIDGKTEEQIGNTVGYSRPTIARYKKRILVKLTKYKT